MKRYPLKFVKHLVLNVNTALTVFKCRLCCSEFFVLGNPVRLWLPVSFFLDLLAHFSPVVLPSTCWAGAASSRAISMLMMKFPSPTEICALMSVLNCIYWVFTLSLKFAHFLRVFNWNLPHMFSASGMVMVSFLLSSCFCNSGNLVPKINWSITRSFSSRSSLNLHLCACSLHLARKSMFSASFCE